MEEGSLTFLTGKNVKEQHSWGQKLKRGNVMLSVYFTNIKRSLVLGLTMCSVKLSFEAHLETGKVRAGIF